MKVRDLRHALLNCNPDADVYAFDPESQTLYLINGGHQMSRGLLALEGDPTDWIVTLLPRSVAELDGGF